MSSNGSPQDWHEGCESDIARNEFIIPKIVESIHHTNSKRIAFLGCATGYIPSQVAEKVSASEFVLIDVDAERLAYAKTLVYRDTEVTFIEQRIENIVARDDIDLMIISNTLLEFNPSEKFVAAINGHVAKHGAVLIFLPDTLEDVVQDYIAGNRLSLSRFIRGFTVVEKTDKFTLVKTNFFAHRLVHLAKLFLDCGFTMSGVSISSTKPKYYMLELKVDDS